MYGIFELILIFLQCLFLGNLAQHFRCPPPCLCENRPTGMKITCGKRAKELPKIPGMILKEFGIYGASINSLPADSFNELKARELYILWSAMGGRIADDAFDPLGPYLERLFLKDLNLDEIPARLFKQLKALKQLSVDDNPSLKFLPNRMFYPLPNLEVLQLNSNGLVSITDGVFADLPRLLDLELSQNQISSINSKSFLGLYSLKMLDLSHNLLGTIQKNSFRTLQNLEVLNLTSNNIMYIETGAFEGLINLKHLILDGNDITSIDLCSFKGLPDGVTVHLQGNPLICNCDLQFWRDVRVFNLLGLCDRPSLLEGQTLADFDMDIGCSLRIQSIHYRKC